MKSRCPWDVPENRLAPLHGVLKVMLGAVVATVVMGRDNGSGLALAGPAGAEKPTAAQDPVRWDLDSLAAVIHPMQHPMTGRMPLLLWNLPIPRGDAQCY
jgi:hypothetical protein